MAIGGALYSNREMDENKGKNAHNEGASHF